MHELGDSMRRHVLAILLVTMLGGCVTVPDGPSVRVLPSNGKSFETFMQEDSTCRNWAQSQLGSPVQETYDRNMATSAVVGTAVGTGAGAALGAASGHAGAGAAIGAATGLLLGSAAGSGASEVYGAEAQQRYDNSYVQCMYTYGNQIPGVRQPVATRVAAAPPPPSEPAPARVVPPPPPGPPVVAPPEEYEQEPPEFVYSPQLNAYVAVAVPYELVYTGNEYYYYSGGNWFRGPYYNGPWTYVPRTSYPPLFVQYEVVNIRHYRDFEYRRYRRDVGRYDGRLYRPVSRGERYRPRY